MGDTKKTKPTYVGCPWQLRNILHESLWCYERIALSRSLNSEGIECIGPDCPHYREYEKLNAARTQLFKDNQELRARIQKEDCSA